MSESVIEWMAAASHAACDDETPIADWFTIEGHAKCVRAALAAAEEAGWVLVPKEPTEEMRYPRKLLFSCPDCTHIDVSGDDVSENGLWRAMLEKAPKP